MICAESVPVQRFSNHQLTALDARLDGDIVHCQHPDYQRARRIWNAMIDRHPAVIVRCQTDDDVVTAIEFAREHGAALTVKGGGHSVAGHSMIDGGVVIDLGPMRRVSVDPEARTVRVGGGCLLADMDRATQIHGLATPAGVMSETGVAGLALGGGVGWLTRKYGLTCDNLLSARVALADGSVVNASANENADLFWSLRGAGTNFGVVTEFEFTTHVVAQHLPVGTAMYRLDNAADAIAHYDQLMRRAPDDLKVVVYLRRAFAEPGVPDELVDAPVCVMVSVWTGDAEDARSVNQELLRGAPPVFSGIQAMPFIELQSANDALFGPGACNYTKGGYLGAMTDDCIDSLVESARRLPSAISVLEISYQHGAQGRLAEDDTAFPDRHADHFLNVLTRWHPDDERGPYIDWARRTFETTSAWHSGGIYSNFLAYDDEARVPEAYRNGKYERLATIKAKYDPGNIFNSNPNIPPANVIERNS
ncbi:FAD-linked oxidase [Mycobacterium montefiorense]|uniref:FAD-linked oxidase n=2 Tax=Mycobacterium montefiorense TaxID=154654 RepID=A0AA37PMX3_9MYCO|nr:FAD-linked oxidase [Mycobacterium montefiorense]GKU36751.1 FAD-linked oxidase [Mycobacterium montefiorense]GKU42870.1 FAD-linked oxidase [Mycobacterium montefiorense]GKU48310.1 FAD-linked oxidase [Mycobacterium montefiorense]GKU50811.1 FAD-linked oxidase [Mycobacterium montefiorense]